MDYLTTIKSITYFVLAGFFLIGGGYLVWLWLREGKPLGHAVLGGIILVLYGVIPTLQPANFGRVYAAYGGVFVVLSILWGWKIDKIAPDRFDIIGARLLPSENTEGYMAVLSSFFQIDSLISRLSVQQHISNPLIFFMRNCPFRKRGLEGGQGIVFICIYPRFLSECLYEHEDEISDNQKKEKTENPPKMAHSRRESSQPVATVPHDPSSVMIRIPFMRGRAAPSFPADIYQQP